MMSRLQTIIISPVLKSAKNCRGGRAGRTRFSIVGGTLAPKADPAVVFPFSCCLSIFAFSFSPAAPGCHSAPQGAIKCLLLDREFPSVNLRGVPLGFHSFCPRHPARFCAGK